MGAATMDNGNRTWLLWIAGVLVSLLSTGAVAYMNHTSTATTTIDARTAQQAERIAKLEATVAAQAVSLDKIDAKLDRVLARLPAEPR